MLDHAVMSVCGLSASLWKLRSGCVLSWREMDGEWLVFDAGAGDTHLLDAVTALILDHLEDRAVSEAQLLDAFAAELDVGAPADLWAEPVQQALRALVQVGLIEPASESAT